MLFPGIVAATLMIAACAVVSVDSVIGKSVLYAFYQWKRRRRSRACRGRGREVSMTRVGEVVASK